MPTHQAADNGWWSTATSIASGAASAVGSAGSAIGSLLGMGGGVPDFGPVIGPQFEDEGYFPNPDGGDWYGLPPLEDLYGEDNGSGSGGMPFGLLDDKTIDEINESARNAGGGDQMPFGLIDSYDPNAIY